MEVDTSLLKEIGLTDGEIKVYLALFKIGKSSTGNIVKEAGVHTSKVYPILDRLIEKGLVTYVKEGKITIYSASAPKNLLDYLEKKQEEIEKQKKDAKKLVDELSVLNAWEKTKQEASVLKTLRGFETAVESFTKNSKGEILVFGMQEFKANFQRKFLDLLHDMKGEIRICVSEKNQELEKKIRQIKSIKVKTVQQEFFMPALILISNNSVVLSVEQGNSTFYIENSEIADSFKTYFENFWKSTTRIYSGVEGAAKVIDELIEAGKKGLPNYGFGTHDNPYRTIVPDELDRFFEAEKKYNIDTKLLFMEGGEHVQPSAQVKYLPKKYLSPVRTMIYGDSVAMVDFTDPITTIIIDKKEVAESFKNYFMTLWDLGKE